MFGSRRSVEWASVTLGLALLVAAFTWPQIRYMNSVPDRGDPLFSIWRISWVNHQIVRNPLALFDANIFYPERLTLTYSDPVIVPALMSAPLFWLGVQKVHIYNLLFLSAFVLSGLTMYLLVRALTNRRAAAVVAAVVFVLYPYRFEHYSHLELQMTMWMPLALWGLHRTIADGRLRDGLLTGLAFALQMLSSLYCGMFFAVYLVVLGVALLIGRRFPRRPLAMLAVGAALAAVLIAPVAAAYVANKSVLGDRDTDTVKLYSATAADYLKPHGRSLVYERWSHGGNPERQLFPRLSTVALAVVGLWPPLSVARIAYWLALAAAVDGSLGLNGLTFPLLREYVPGFAGLRVPARFSMLAGMTLAILGGYGASRLLDRYPRRRGVLMFAMLAPVLVEALPLIQLEPVWREPPAIYSVLAGRAPGVIAEFPTPIHTRIPWSDTKYLYFSTFHWQKLVNGNSGFEPPSYVEFLERERDFPSEASVRYLRERGVEYIGLHGAFTNPVRFGRTSEFLDARPDLTLVGSAQWYGAESRLYRFTR